MSSQVMSLLLAQEPCPHVRGLVLYVFPMRWRVLLQNTVTHLPQVHVPMLFIQGDRDHEFCDLTQLQPVLNQLRPPAVIPASPAGTQQHPTTKPHLSHPWHPAPPNAPTPHATLHVIPGANHSFELPDTSNRTQQHAITEAATTTATWIRQQLQTSP